MLIKYWLFLILIPSFATAQDNKVKYIDSLKKEISNAKHDSIKINALMAWDNLIYIENPDLDLKLNSNILILSEKNIANSKSQNSKKYFIASRITALNNLGLIYSARGIYDKSIENFTECLLYYEKTDYKLGLANATNNIGLVYYNQGLFKKALKYYFLSLEKYTEIDDKKGIATSYSNIGLVYNDLKDYEKGKMFINKGHKIIVLTNDKNAIANSYTNMGDSYLYNLEFDSAIFEYKKGIEMHKQNGSKRGMAFGFYAVGKSYFKLKNYNESILNTNKALKLANETNSLRELSLVYKQLYLTYKAINNSTKALKMYELHTITSDSVFNQENKSALIKQEYKYQYEKEHFADSLAFVQQQELNRKEHEVILEKEVNRRYLLYSGIGFLCLLGFVGVRGYLRKKKDHVLILKQKEEVDAQKHILTEKNKEITDSIIYAKRIQNAILPPDNSFDNWFQDSFIYYKPKDIVAGDFYWIEEVNNQLIFAVADCTGHGVPGALVSVVCHNALSRAVREYKLIKPGNILSKTREIVVNQFAKNDDNVKDGMDIAMCSIVDNTLYFSGANNPVWIIRKGELIEVKGQKQPIGKFEKSEPFQTSHVEVFSEDCIYIFSDGFADQFGGEKGKKFKSKNFKQLLISICNLPFDDQKKVINDTFKKWKGELEQLDDICIIGVKHKC